MSPAKCNQQLDFFNSTSQSTQPIPTSQITTNTSPWPVRTLDMHRRSGSAGLWALCCAWALLEFVSTSRDAKIAPATSQTNQPPQTTQTTFSSPLNMTNHAPAKRQRRPRVLCCACACARITLDVFFQPPPKKKNTGANHNQTRST